MLVSDGTLVLFRVGDTEIRIGGFKKVTVAVSTTVTVPLTIALIVEVPAPVEETNPVI
jgi:hypothetical protein